MPRQVPAVLRCTLPGPARESTTDSGGLAKIYRRRRNNADWRSVEIK